MSCGYCSYSCSCDGSYDHNYDQEFEDKYSSFSNYLTKNEFKYIGCGSFRHVYSREKVVIKIPRNYNGRLDNIMEAKAYRK